MITGLDKVYHGHYSVAFPAGTLPQSAVSGVTKNTIVGETMGDKFIYGSGAPSDPTGFTSDKFEITGLYITNTENEAFTLTMQIQYGTTFAAVSVIPPMSTTYIITADDPQVWYGGGLTATLSSRLGAAVSFGAVAMHLNYKAMVED